MPALFWDAAEGNDPSPNWHMKPVSDLLKPRLLLAVVGVELPEDFSPDAFQDRCLKPGSATLAFYRLQDSFCSIFQLDLNC